MSSRRGLAEKVPLALEQACKYIVPVLLTTLLVYLLYVRFDRPPVPPCYYNAKPSTMYALPSCGEFFFFHIRKTGCPCVGSRNGTRTTSRLCHR